MPTDPPGRQQVEGLPFRALLEALDASVFVTDAAGANIYVNARFAEFTGIAHDLLAGPGWLDALHPDDAPSVLRAWEAAFKARVAYSVEYRLRNAAGRYRWQLVRTRPMAWEGDPAAYWIGVLTDVHDHRLAETAARESALQLRLASGAAGVGFYSVDVITAELRWSAEAKRILGQPADIHPDVPLFYSIIHAEDRPAVQAAGARSVDRSEPDDDYRVEYRITRANDGAMRWINARGRTLFAGEGGDRVPVRFVGCVMDVTDRKAGEEKLADALAARDMMLSEVNHRVKNSLQIVASLISLNAHRLPPGDARTALEEARARVGVVAAIHERLYMTDRYGTLELGPFLHGIAADALRSGAPDRVRLDFDAEQDIEIEVARAIPLGIILNELATNAVKYAWAEWADGVLAVKLHRVGGQLHITVADDGPGVPEGFSLAGGAGLGLRIVNALVRQLRGAVEVRSGPNGSTFDLLLPL